MEPPTGPIAPLPPAKRPRGRPKIVKTDSSGELGSPSNDSVSDSPREAGDSNADPSSMISTDGKKKPKKITKRPQSAKESQKKDNSVSISGGMDDASPKVRSVIPIALTESQTSSTGNPLKVRSISTGVFTQALLGALMTGPPLSISEIAALIPNVTLDQLQGILDTLQLFGIIDKIQLQPQFVDDDIVESEVSNLGSSTARKPISRTQKLYVMAGYTRGTAMIDIRTVTKDSLKRAADAAVISDRASKIQKFSDELADMDIDPAEKAMKAQKFFQDLMSSDPSLGERPIYQHISKQIVDDAAVVPVGSA